MEDIIKNVKTSSMFDETEHLIKEMIENIGIIRQNRGANSSTVTDQKRIIENEIQELRTKINNHLDKLQEATIIWACLSVFLTKFISQGFDSTTTSANI
jgi:hypothetical protein